MALFIQKTANQYIAQVSRQIVEVARDLKMLKVWLTSTAPLPPEGGIDLDRRSFISVINHGSDIRPAYHSKIYLPA